VDYYDAYPDLTPDLLSEWAVLDTHDTLTDRYKHLRDPEEIRATLIELGLANVEVRAGGNGVEARALGSAGERRGSGREVSVRFAHAPEAA
jgi:hypothetical protein